MYVIIDWLFNRKNPSIGNNKSPSLFYYANDIFVTYQATKYFSGQQGI
jgi:hypothetical protein